MNSESITNWHLYDKDVINPFDLGNVRLILDPSNSSFSDTGMTTKSVANGSCAGLRDGSENGFSFTQSLSDNKPTFKTGGRNNNNYLDFAFGASGNSFMACASRSALKCLHDGTGGSIYVVAEMPYATANLAPGNVLSTNNLSSSTIGFSLTTDLSIDGTNLYSSADVSNGASNIGHTQLYGLNYEFRVIGFRVKQSLTPDMNMRLDSDFGSPTMDTSDVINEANFSGSVSSSDEGADITIGEVGVDTGAYCVMKLYLVIAYDECLSDYNHDRLLQYFKARFDLPEYTIV